MQGVESVPSTIIDQPDTRTSVLAQKQADANDGSPNDNRGREALIGNNDRASSDERHLVLGSDGPSKAEFFYNREEESNKSDVR